MKPTDATIIRTGSAIVLGSINVDTFIYVDHFPLPGETILARRSSVGLGGKGANQAMAAALLGADVQFMGHLGHDTAGNFAKEQLDSFGVSSHLVKTSAELPTGAAYVTVNASGENTITVVAGANGHIPVEGIGQSLTQALTHAREPATIALAQGETTAAATEEFARQCQARGIRFVLNLAPVIDVDEDVLALADPLIVNAGEACLLLKRATGRDAMVQTPAAAQLVAQLLAEKVAKSAIITLGADGAVVADGVTSWHQPSPVPERVVDTTGAGDAFVGTVVALLSGGSSLHQAVCAAVAAGSAAVSRSGTASSYVRAQELEVLLAASKVPAP